jgi:cytochrome P450
MSIIGKVLFEKDVFSETDELGAAMQTALEHVNAAASVPFPLPLSLPLPRHIRTRQALATLRQSIQYMIDERRSRAPEKDDFLSLLLKARDEEGGMSDQQVFDEALTLFGAGHETTATALTWAWYLLMTHPEVYKHVQQEVDSVLQDRSPHYDDLVHLPYTLKVFKETLRLYPPAFATSRTALCDVEVGRYTMQKGETVLISPYVIHRRPDYFPNPEQFDPERFAPENEKQLPRYAFLPFGAGPRICIGNHFATMEGHLLLATLAQRITFDLVPGQDIVAASKVTIRPKDGVNVVVQRRGVRSG